MIEYRPWGYFKVLYENDNIKLKEICIEKGHKISLQKHRYRDEFWIIIQGTAIVEINGARFAASEGGKYLLNKGDIHRIEALTQTKIIELQYGERVDEQDIVRFQDDYGRM